MSIVVDSTKRLFTFDLFDTLIARPVRRPTSVFDILKHQDINFRFFAFRVIGFKKIRVFSERIARKKSGKQDVNIFDIYRVVSWFVANPSEVLRREIKLELALVKPIQDNVSAFKSLINEGRDCLILSDMYLPSAVIRKIINQHVDPRAKFLVSSKESLTKATGDLFIKVAQIRNVDFPEMQHFGDNPHSDYNVPKSLGIDAVKLPELNVSGGGKELFDHFYFRGGDDFEKIGFSLVGPMCYKFAKFIAEDAIARGLDRVIFASRDGYLVKEAFDLLNTGIESRYVRLSRRALYVPSFSVTGDYEKFFEGRINAKEFFERIGLVCPEHLINLIPYSNREVFIQYLESIGFSEMASEEAETLIGYLGYNGFSGKVGFCDLGWRGSLQAAIQDLLGMRCDLHGYYFGSISKPSSQSSFYFDNGAPYSRCAIIFQALPVFEFLFTEPIHTLGKIYRDNESGFSYEFVCDERQEQINLRKSICNGARTFFDTLYPALPHISDGPSLRELDKLLVNYLVRPDTGFVGGFVDVGHSEGFGGSKHDLLLSSDSPSLLGYRNSYWRSAYALRSKSWIIKFAHLFVYSRFGIFLIINKKRVRKNISRGIYQLSRFYTK